MPVVLPLAPILLASCLALGSCGSGETAPPAPPPGAIPAGQAVGSAAITGRVLLSGTPPERQRLKLSDAGCQHGDAGEQLSEGVVANPDGTLRNVVISITSGLGDRVFAPPGPATMDQKGCVFLPHVIAVQTNQIVTFLNSDPTLHNVHAVSKLNSPFNVGLAVKGQRVSRFFGKPEIVKMKCDVHSWMSAYIAVLANPFHAVTGDGGAFTIPGLPAGQYEVEAWHETYGRTSQSVTLSEGESKTIEFRLGT